MSKAYLMSVDEVMEALGISRSKAYEVIEKFNEELAARNYFTYKGKIPRPFFMEKCYGYESVANTL